MKKKILLLAKSFVLLAIVHAQSETFDIASFTPPSGWQRMDSNGIVAFLDSRTNNGLTSFCQIFLYPSHSSSGNPKNDFKTEWNTRVSLPTKTTTKPKTEFAKTPEGWNVTKGYANITHLGITYTCMLITATGFGKTMSIMVNMAGSDYLTEVDKFFNGLNLDSKATASENHHETKNTPTNTKDAGSLNDYDFIPPERWYTQKSNDYILLSQTQSLERGCIIQIFPAQPSSGDLEKDAKTVFSQMYPGWQYRFSGEKHDDLSKGYTSQGLEYCMIEAAMQKQRPDGYYYDYENGAAIVIKAGDQIRVITARHERGELVCFCKYQYEYWPKFFNSFSVKNITAPKNINEELAKRLIGSWQTVSNVLLKYIFAANGHYQFIGAYSTSNYIGPNLIEYKTSSFKGDGTYSLKGNQLTTVKGGVSSTVRFRLEKVNHGNAGWTERLYIIDSFEGKPNEVCYEKEKQ